eukprot:scaffold303919_cov22-Tisochrysis_lutea.AAC.1
MLQEGPQDGASPALPNLLEVLVDLGECMLSDFLLEVAQARALEILPALRHSFSFGTPSALTHRLLISGQGKEQKVYAKRPRALRKASLTWDKQWVCAFKLLKVDKS